VYYKDDGHLVLKVDVSMKPELTIKQAHATAWKLRKLIEESAEVITAKDKENLIWECSDLIYFLFVIMAKEGVTILDVEEENERRNK
jgi:phosphoribosyl-ATP pyrophosphohydrolase